MVIGHSVLGGQVLSCFGARGSLSNHGCRYGERVVERALGFPPLRVTGFDWELILSTYSHSGRDSDEADDGLIDDARERRVAEIREAIARGSYDVDVRLEELTTHLRQSIEDRDADEVDDEGLE
jgi:Anti-sigma-28 factor, FlgM